MHQVQIWNRSPDNRTYLEEVLDVTAAVFFLLPGPDIQLAAVDDTRELEQNGKPATDPHPITRGNIHVITGVFPQGLDRDTAGHKFIKWNIILLFLKKHSVNCKR